MQGAIVSGARFIVPHPPAVRPYQGASGVRLAIGSQFVGQPGDGGGSVHQPAPGVPRNLLGRTAVSDGMEEVQEHLHQHQRKQSRRDGEHPAASDRLLLHACPLAARCASHVERYPAPRPSLELHVLFVVVALVVQPRLGFPAGDPLLAVRQDRSPPARVADPDDLFVLGDDEAPGPLALDPAVAGDRGRRSDRPAWPGAASRIPSPRSRPVPSR